MKRSCSAFLGVLFLLLVSQNGKSQSSLQLSPQQFVAYSLFNFSRMVNWSEKYKSGDFSIAVVGNSKISEELSRITNHKLNGGQKYDVKEFRKINELDGFHHIVFIDNCQCNELSDLLNKAGNKGSLIVTNKKGLLEYGSVINFIEQNQRYTFEINPETASSYDLQISSQLANMAMK